jgi:L-ascorbate metabolism protein UlaG (beta-lactamase superfamily)
MKIIYYGQSCFGIEMGGKKLLFDPFITPNDLAKDIDVEKIEADYILVSHGHQDHIADLVSIAKRTNAKVIGIWEVTAWLGKQGIENVHPMNIGGKWKFDFGTVKCVNAVHSSTFPDGSSAGNPMGFVLWNDDGCFYFAGDTALTMDMKLIPMICPTLDFAILPIGDNFTMDFHDAVLASDFIDCGKIVGCHFDTFGFIEIDHKAAKKVFEDKRKELILPTIGESLTI